MEDRIKEFLASGKLEAYVYGTIDQKDQMEVENYINTYPQVKEEYQVLQDQLENISQQQAIKAPLGMKSKILDSLPNQNANTPVKTISWSKYIAAASLIAAVLFGWNWKNALNQLNAEKGNYAVLASECEEREKQIEDQNTIIAFLNSEQTQRIEMNGNQLAPDFKALVYVNAVFGKAILKPIESPYLPENKCLQLWGDLNGEMVPIAVLDRMSTEDLDLEIKPGFTSLNLTIEEKTADGEGQLHPDVSKLISSIVI